MRNLRRGITFFVVAVFGATLTVPASAAGVTFTTWAGADRYATAASVAYNAFPEGSPTVYVATGQNFPDALAAAPAAVADRAPILLVAQGSVPEATSTAIRNMGPTEIVVLGGPAAVSEPVLAELRGIAPVTVVAGEDRFATAAAVSKRSFGTGGVVHVAAGDTFADALVGGAAAGVKAGPQLLVTPDGVPAATRDELRRLQPSEVVVVGKVTASAAVRDQLAEATSAPVTLVGGADPYATSAAMADRLFPDTAPGMVVATGRDYPDGLTGGALAGLRGQPLLLTPTIAPPPSVLDAAWRLEPSFVVFVGGPAAIAEETVGLVVAWSALGPDPARNPAQGDGEEAADGSWRLLVERNGGTGGSGTPVRFNPCREIGWVLNPANAPAHALDDVTAAISRLASATGITFKYEGTTAEAPSLSRKGYQPERYGERWAPILIAWAPDAGYPQSPGPAAVGIPITAGAPDRNQFIIVSGTLIMNSTQSTPMRAGYLNLLMHELGHIAGLDHPQDMHTIMQAPGLQPNGVWQGGDLRGLNTVGREAGCFTDPPPA